MSVTPQGQQLMMPLEVVPMFPLSFLPPVSLLGGCRANWPSVGRVVADDTVLWSKGQCWTTLLGDTWSCTRVRVQESSEHV